jgi:hypothetical protein
MTRWPATKRNPVVTKAGAVTMSPVAAQMFYVLKHRHILPAANAQIC